MGVVHFLLNIYFAAVLGIAGLAKLDDPNFFISVLHYQHIFPKWSIPILGKVFPWIEIAFPVILLISVNIYKSITTVFLLIIFIILPECRGYNTWWQEFGCVDSRSHIFCWNEWVDSGQLC